MSEPAETFNNFLSLIDWIKWHTPLDSVEQSRIGIDLVHHEIHEGKFFSISVIDTDVDTGAPKYIRITAPDTSTRIHFTGQVYVTAASLVEFFENPTISTDGDALTEYNNDRNSSNTPTATTFEDTTVSDDGTRIDAGRAGGAARPNFRIGGETARRKLDMV